MDWKFEWPRFWAVLVGNCVGWTMGILVTTWWMNRRAKK